MLPDTPIENLPPRDILTAHTCIKNSWKFNFMDAQILVVSKLYLAVWDNYLAGYWDNQLPILIRHGFPLEFCCDSPLRWEGKNHTSGTDHVSDIKAYLDEEINFGAICGPISTLPLTNMPISPFMTRPKPNAPHSRVIIDLSFPHNASVNAHSSYYRPFYRKYLKIGLKFLTLQDRN